MARWLIRVVVGLVLAATIYLAYSEHKAYMRLQYEQDMTSLELHDEVQQDIVLSGIAASCISQANPVHFHGGRDL